MTSNNSSPLELSLLIPTYGRSEIVSALLQRLAKQTLDANQFEVVVVDDGSEVPIELDATDYPFHLELHRQENAGPASARNTGLRFCRAPLTLILNDDAVPAADLCEQHLVAHATLKEKGQEKCAVLGTFTFDEESLQSPFTQVLANSDLLFSFEQLKDKSFFNWQFFWTCNISLATEALREVDGFDEELFDRALVEDVELGYRLEKNGYRVFHWAAARCEHHHALSPESYRARGRNLGKYIGRMYKKHGDKSLLWGYSDNWKLRDYLSQVQMTCENLYGSEEKFYARASQFETERWGQNLSSAHLEQMRSLVKRTAFVGFGSGLLGELEGNDPIPTLTKGPRGHRLTSILVVTHDALDQTRRCLEALRACSEAAHPTEIIFVDNGSADGTVDFLREQDDVQLISNAKNLGAPRARNQALELAKGDHVVFMDNDVMVTPGWLGRLLFHAEVDGRSGCVGCLSDRAGQNQQIAYPADSSDPEVLADYAGMVSEKNHRRYRNQGLMTSFLLMVRREVLDAIGGFDERFSPWGFEDDDFSLRAYLAGFRNRVALDVFVRHEPYQGAKKKAKHDGLLQRNWKRFAKKWGLPKTNAYGNCKGLERLNHGGWSHADLRQPLNPNSDQLDSVPSPTRSISERPGAPEPSRSAAGDALELA